MRKWGILISVFYVLILLFLLVPILGYVLGDDLGIEFDSAVWFLQQWAFDSASWRGIFLCLVILVAAQVLLLFVSVDTSFRRQRPRRHINVSIATVVLAVGLLSSMAIFSISVAIAGDDLLGGLEEQWVNYFLALLAGSWLIWGLVFYYYKADTSDKVSWMTRWLIKGSILELLIAVPCHIIVRSRGDCSAPLVSGLGIATGIAVMLLAFGPAVLLLYQKRLNEYGRKQSAD